MMGFMTNLACLLLPTSIHAFSVNAGSGSSSTTSDTTFMGGGPINVVVERSLPPGITPAKAHEAWLSYTWEKGGGLPNLVILKEQNDEKDGGNTAAAAVSAKRGTKSVRLITPLMFEETLFDDKEDIPMTKESGISEKQEQNDVIQKYAITKLGLLESDIEAGSHLGTVRFATKEEGGGGINTVMTWTATSNAIQRRGLWEELTKSMINDACDNLVSYVTPPQLYTRRTRLVFGKKKEDDTFTAAARMGSSSPCQDALDAWLNFVWNDGGGFPIPLPFGLSMPLLVRLGNSDKRTRMLIPPFIKESLVSVDTDNCEVNYKVDNPSLFTYQVHTHSGRVKFVPADNNNEEEVDMIWEVMIRPYHNWSGIVQSFTSAIVSMLATNLKVHLLEGPDAMVSLSPPRGFGGKPFGQVRKDSWIGGVLASHLSDDRSVLEQTVSMFQPWTWGRGGGVVDDDYDSEEWTVMDQ